jgi:hypothetical protein
MKKLVILLSLMVFACSSDDNERENHNNVPQEDTLIGTWELIESYGSDGSNDSQWSVVQEQFRYTYTFRVDNSMRWDDNYDCDGVYENNTPDFLEINFDCTDSQFTGTYHMAFENHNLILIPEPNCPEACALKFRKISSN